MFVVCNYMFAVILVFINLHTLIVVTHSLSVSSSILLELNCYSCACVAIMSRN